MRGPLVRILIAATVLRLVAPFAAMLLPHFAGWPFILDAPQYLSLARSLFGDGEFARLGVPEVFRTPGYPLVLASVMFTDHPVAVAIGLQVVIGVVTVWLVFLLARAIGNDRLAIAAAWLAAVDPSLVQYASHLMPETVFAALVTTICLVWVCVPQDSARRAILLGLLASAAALVRPVAYYLPIVLAALLWITGRTLPWRVKLRTSTLVLCVAALILGGWQARNLRVAGYNGFSTQIDRQLYLTTGAFLKAEAEHRPFADVRREFIASVAATTGDTNEIGPAFTAEARRRGAAFVRDHPWAVLRVQLAGSLVTLFDPPGSDELQGLITHASPPRDRLLWFALSHSPLETWRQLPPDRAWLFLRLTYAAHWAMFLVLMVIGIATRGRYPGAASRLSVGWGITAYLLLASGGYFAVGRFRVPLMPLFCIVAAAGALWVVERRKAWKNWRTGLATG